MHVGHFMEGPAREASAWTTSTLLVRVYASRVSPLQLHDCAAPTCECGRLNKAQVLLVKDLAPQMRVCMCVHDVHEAKEDDDDAIVDQLLGYICKCKC